MTRHWLSISRSGVMLASGVLALGLSTWLGGDLARAADLPKQPEKLTTSQAVDAYMAVLLDEHQTNIRRNYAGAKIVELGKPAVPVILDRYKAAGRDERGYLASLLGAMGKSDEAEAVLLADLKDHKLAVHANVIKALGEMNSSKALPVLIKLLPGADGNAAEPGLRLTMLHAIADSGDETAAAVLMDGLDDRDRLVRSTCGNGLVGVLKRGQETMKKAEVRTDRDSAKEAYDKVLNDVTDYCKDGKCEDSRLILISGLGELNDLRAAKDLLDVLDNGSTVLRTAAAETLGKLRAQSAERRLTDMLKDKDAVLRTAAVKALAMIGDRRCVPGLMEYLKTAPIGERKEIVKSLRTLTGQGFGESWEAWQTWWTSQEH